ncbi:hypothetical protein FC778_13445 [Clostridium botulinum]|nr:hypothetical protein [Clostridium botulinum]
MRNKLIAWNVAIKTKLGLCCSKGCFHRAVVDVNLPQVNVKRCLCDKYLRNCRKIYQVEL